MKATLLLVVCLAGVSVQQNLFWPFPSQARFQYLPQLINQKADAQQEANSNEKAQDREGRAYMLTHPQFVTYNPFYHFYGNVPHANLQEAEGRVNEDVQSRSFPQGRLFFNGLFGGFGFLSTSYSFVSTVITSTTTKFCTEAAAFNSTLSCRRRREALWQLLEAPERIEASQVIPVEATAVAREEPSVEQVEISSSFEPQVDPASARKARTFATVATVTVTTLASTTATATVTSTIRSSAILLPGSKLQCLPVGASIC